MFRVNPPQSCSSSIVKLTSSNFLLFLFPPFSFHSLELSYSFFHTHTTLCSVPSFFAQHFIPALLRGSLGTRTMIGNFQKRERESSGAHLISDLLSSVVLGSKKANETLPALLILHKPQPGTWLCSAPHTVSGSCLYVVANHYYTTPQCVQYELMQSALSSQRGARYQRAHNATQIAMRVFAFWFIVPVLSCWQ